MNHYTDTWQSYQREKCYWHIENYILLIFQSIRKIDNNNITISLFNSEFSYIHYLETKGCESMINVQQHKDHIIIFHLMERRNCALIMLKRVGGSQDMLIGIPCKKREHSIVFMS